MRLWNYSYALFLLGFSCAGTLGSWERQNWFEFWIFFPIMLAMAVIVWFQRLGE
jgi:formate hydrogenlyase subunit 3/multisubunit Na+/H+ antiporter MnhD subunit